MGKMVIGSVSTDPGTKSYGSLEVALRPDGTSIVIPLIVINGIKEGPTLVVDAGHHGNEYEGVEVIMKLGQTIDPKKLKGVFIGIPVLNVPAFIARTRGNLLDFDTGHHDANRVYPGRSDGCLTERIVYKYYHEVVPKADYLITFHSGGDRWYAGPLVVYHSSKSVSKASKETAILARAFGVEILQEELGPIYGDLFTKAVEDGIPTICPEIGGYCDIYRNRKNLVNIGIRGVNNIMKHIEMLEGHPILPNKQLITESRGYIQCKNGGLQFPEVKVGDRVNKGDLLIRIVNPFNGEEIERITAQEEGLVVFIIAIPRAYPGDWVVGVNKILKEITN